MYRTEINKKMCEGPRGRGCWRSGGHLLTSNLQNGEKLIVLETQKFAPVENISAGDVSFKKFQRLE